MAQLSDIEPVMVGRATSFDHLLTPLDGSEAADRAVPVADDLARALGAELHLIGVAATDEQAEGLRAHLEEVDARLDRPAASRHVLVGGDPAAAIQAAAKELDRSVVCMASHGHGWLATKLLGSVACSVLMSSRRPTVMVGPEAGPGDLGGPVLACVDGSVTSEATVPLALAWSELLAVGTAVVTVAEPVPPSLGSVPTYRRRFGPSMDADAYVRDVAERYAPKDGALGRVAIYDPLSPADGLVGYLRTHPVRLLVATSRTVGGHTHPFVGSAVASIVRHSPVPVVVQPPGY